MQSGPDAFDKSRFIMIFLTIVGVIEILCSFRLEVKTGKEILESSRTLLQRLPACLNFTLESGDWSFWYKRKKWFPWTSSTSSWKQWRWVKLYLIPSVRDIYISSNFKLLTKVASSSRSTEFKDILSWTISQMITKTILISTRIVISYAMKRGIPLRIWWKANGNWDNNMIRISQ